MVPPPEAEHPPDGSAASSEAKERLAEALRILEDEGRTAFDRFVDARPDLAPEVRRRVRELSRLGLLASGGDAEPQGDGIGERIGPYRLIERLGVGGMGVVYLAEHVDLGRRVAVKTLPHRVVLSARARERFLRESRAVAQLDHPCVVPVYEVGEHDGVPWFAMQYVRGRTLADLVAGLNRSGVPTGELRSRHLSKLLRGESVERAPSDGDPGAALQREPLPQARGKTYIEMVCRLVHDVAEALEHAHSHGVLHRDVKPSNILVNDEGRARLFDFGLADVENEASLTLTKEFVGTPYYVSPEQIAGHRDAIDARTDVYSLGVTLYELLTLRLPFGGKTTQQVLRQIQSREPPWPRKLNPLVPRDLETICLTAMEKAPERRYARAADLAADLRRFLEFRPIQARPVGAVTRLLRFGRRHRAASTATALAALLFVGVPVALFVVNLRIQRERDAAQRAFEFLEQVVFESDAEEAGATATAADVIARAGERVLAELGDAPEVRARLLTKIGAYFSISNDLARSTRYLEEALNACLTLYGEDHPETAGAMNYLANAFQSLGRTKDAELLYRRAAAAYEAALGPDHEETLIVLGNLAGFLGEYERPDEADGILQRIERSYRRQTPLDAKMLGQTVARRARLLYMRRRFDEASDVYLQAIELLESVPPETTGKQLYDVWGGWARVRLESGHVDDAERGFRRQRDGVLTMFGEDSYFYGACTIFLGEVAARRGDTDEAVRRFDEGLACYEAALSPTHPATLDFAMNLVDILRRAERLDDAESRRTELLERIAGKEAELPSEFERLTLQGAFLLDLRGDHDAALAQLDVVVTHARATDADDPATLLRRLAWLARVARRDGFEEFAEIIDAAGPERD